MTISSTASRMPPYAGNGSATAFPVAIPFPDADCIRAILARPGQADADLVRDTDFTLSGAGDPAGGTLTFPKAGSAYSILAEGETLHVLRVVPLTQERSWDNVDAIDAGQIEAGDDRLTMLCQQLQEQLDRCVRWPATTTDPDAAPAGLLPSLLASEAAAAAARTAAESARDVAQAARDQAVAAAAALDFPTVTTGDAGKLLRVAAEEDGYELAAPATAATASTIAARDAAGNLTANAFIGTVRYA